MENNTMKLTLVFSKRRTYTLKEAIKLIQVLNLVADDSLQSAELDLKSYTTGAE